MNEINYEISASSSVNFREKQSVIENDTLLQHVIGDLTLGFSNSNSVESIQVDKRNYNDIEKIQNEINIQALERLIYSLLKEGNTLKAKKTLEEFSEISSPLLDKWTDAISRLANKKSGKASLSKNEIEDESKWIKKYSNKFTSQWVALISGKVIAANSNLKKLREEVERFKNTDNVTFLKL